MIIECQQQDILKIKDNIPGHGPQEVGRRCRPFQPGSERVILACGCILPIPWLPLMEQQAVYRNLKPAMYRKGNNVD